MSRRLEGITSLYLDSNILIYLVEGNAALGELVVAAFREIETHDINLFTSEIAMTECLNGPYRDGLQVLAEKYIELLGTKEFITLLPVDIDVCIEAARLGADHRLKTVDSIHLASARLSGCQAFLSNDGGFKSIDDLRIVQLAEFSVNQTPKAAEKSGGSSSLS